MKSFRDETQIQWCAITDAVEPSLTPRAPPVKWTALLETLAGSIQVRFIARGGR